MGNIEKINDYFLELDSDSTNVPSLELILENLGILGNKARLLKYIASIYQLGLPYRHTIYISDDGEVTIDIFEKNQEPLNPPEKYKLGVIQNYRD